jgi:hypothetical protein
VAEFDEVIAPGQEGKVTLEVLGEKVSGTWRKSATVISNDPKHPRLTIALSGTVINHVDVEPKRVYLRGMYGETVTAELTVSSVEKKKDLKILDVTSNIDDKITYKVIEDSEPGQYKVELFKNPKLPTLNTWGSVFIKTNSEKTPDKIVQVNVVTRGAIIVQPSTLNFGNVQPAAPTAVEKIVTVSKIKGDFSIQDVTFSSDSYKADIEQVEKGKKYKLKIQFHPEVEQKSYVDEMIISTDDPQEPSIRVRLIARGIAN